MRQATTVTRNGRGDTTPPSTSDPDAHSQI